MGSGNAQRKRTFARDVGANNEAPRISEPVDSSDLAGLMSRRSRKQLPWTKRATGPKFQGQLRIAEPVKPEDIKSGNLTLAQGCDVYVTPDCLRRKEKFLMIDIQSSDLMIRDVRHSQRHHEERW
jgi:hypothetical protein